ncbi:MAG: nucleotidyltransferase family protein [Bacteroidaceae bacterium]|nr:nucleotidyltransferase family protein [Bacteroidaceae bacterium]
MQSCFFELLRVSLGVQKNLSYIPSEQEWMEIYSTTVKQSVAGICFAGLQALGVDTISGCGIIGIDEKLYLNWMATALHIQQNNEKLNRQSMELQATLSEKGIRSSILKGQGIALLYGELALLRQSGDIDIYVDCGRRKALDYANTIQKNVEWDYKHLHLNIFDDTEVEMHYVPEIFLNLSKNKKLQKWFAAHKDWMFDQIGAFVTPSAQFNLFYILLHIYRHFLYEGVGMRQLTDYYFVLKSASKDKIQATHNLLVEFGMLKFASGVMWIMQNFFGLSVQMILCEPCEKEGRYILEQVMTGGNFGHYDKRLVSAKFSGKIGTFRKIIKHNLHLLSHYPDAFFWTPVYFVWHKLWKLFNNK